jgi:serine/threonine protein kinase
MEEVDEKGLTSRQVNLLRELVESYRLVNGRADFCFRRLAQTQDGKRLIEVSNLSNKSEQFIGVYVEDDLSELQRRGFLSTTSTKEGSVRGFVMTNRVVGEDQQPTLNATTLLIAADESRGLRQGFNERYEIVRELGSGGTSRVHLAIDKRLDRNVAIKEILVENERQRSALEHEGNLLANLHHPSLPAVIDFFTNDGRPMIVMQFIPGDNLHELLINNAGPFSQQQILQWGIELLEVLEYLHSRRPPIIHRDLKPSNLKLTEHGRVILLDFGLSKGSAGQMSTIVDTPKSIHGFTRDYAPLEQIHGTGTDERSDLFSLAATLFHLATAQKPSSAPDRYQSQESTGIDPLQLATQINTEISFDVSRILAKAMAIRPANRYGSAAEMRDALLPCLSETSSYVQEGSQTEHPRKRDIDSDLQYAIDVDRELAFRERRRTWRTTTEGVISAEQNVAVVFDELRELAKKSDTVLKQFHLSAFLWSPIEFALCGAGYCLFLLWNCPSSERLADSTLAVQVSAGRFDIREGKAVPIGDVKKFQAEYDIDMDHSFTIGWRRRGSDRNLISNSDLARHCLLSLISTIRREADEEDH